MGEFLEIVFSVFGIAVACAAACGLVLLAIEIIKECSFSFLRYIDRHEFLIRKKIAQIDINAKRRRTRALNKEKAKTLNKTKRRRA